MAESPMQPKQDIKFHDRLDLLLHVDDYSDQPCGSLSPSDNKPRYCSHECPTLIAEHTKAK